MLSPAEYTEILRGHGRRVANRVLFASTPVEDRAARGLRGFYVDHAAMYGDESDLPEHERCATDLINAFHPVGTIHLHYGSGTRTFNQWAQDFASMPAEWRGFVYACLFVLPEDEKRAAMLEVLEACPEQEPFLNDLFEISAADMFAIWYLVAESRGNSRWPMPGTREADSLIGCL